jgi:hypothetical protein
MPDLKKGGTLRAFPLFFRAARNAENLSVASESSRQEVSADGNDASQIGSYVAKDAFRDIIPPRGG